MDLQSVLDALRNHPQLGKNITHWKSIPARPARYADFPAVLSPSICRLLKERGIEKLYIHQAQAVDRAGQGEDIVVVTPTASGKTLCYNLPVLNTLLVNKESRALYLFPTKALAQDQVADLMVWSDALGGRIKTYTYDGDTSAEARRAIRLAGNIVVTNPDMLHSGILPHHTKWMHLFENLSYVVIDELHIYRGVFGSHVANVLRRLARICRYYGSTPQFICTSATIANPGEHGRSLIGRKVHIIEENGAPQGPKAVILYNPPVVNQALGIRRSCLLEANSVAQHFLAKNVQTIVFTRSRLNAEVLVSYLRKKFKRIGDGTEKIRGYRGGYLPRQRRAIEKDLREGKVLAVVSTNALELGIDIGTLQVAILTGYPGTIASTWQQMGRAGRSNELSAAVIVGNSSPLNQFVLRSSEYLFGQGAEPALISPDNLFILVSHIKCAAFELPFVEGEEFGDSDPVEILQYLADANVLRNVDGRWFWMSDAFPAADISLRSASSDNFAIIDTTDGGSRVIGEVDRFSAPMLIHTNAIYMHESDQYHVDQLDFDRQKAYVRRVNADYYTDANLSVELKVLDVSEQSRGDRISRAWGEVMVTAKTHMYKKIRFHTHENIGWGEISLPEQELHTTAYWIHIPDSVGQSLGPSRLQNALQGMASLLANIAPLELMCEPQDLGVSAQVRAPFTGEATIYIYERYPGGVGFSERLYGCHNQLLVRSVDLLRACPCADGCPSCVGPIDEVGADGKESTDQILQTILL